MTIREFEQMLHCILNQIYSPTTGKKLSLSERKYNQLYELYDEEEREYQFALGEETQPEYGEDELNDLLDDVCAGLAWNQKKGYEVWWPETCLVVSNLRN